MPQNIQHRYADLNFNFIPNPVANDIALLYDFDDVKQAVADLVLTKHYERPFHPELGCDVTAMLFENIMPLTSIRIQRSIQDVINNFEPRVQLQNVVVSENYAEDGYNITITFYMLNISVLQQINFFLERLR